MRSLLVLGIILASALPAVAAGRPMTVDDLLAVKSVADPQISPDGSRIVYVVTELDRATDKSNSDLWLVPIDGGEPRRLTTSAGADNNPRWMPDGKSIAFLSTRGGSAQVWVLPMDGGEARQVTRLPIDVGNLSVSPRGDKFAFTAEVYPGKTPEETAAKDKEKEAGKSKARIFDGLMIRHWSSWDEGKRSHLFVADAKTGAATDLIPKWTANVPPAPFGGPTDYAWSTDGQELAFTSEPLEGAAWSTNTDIWTVPASGGEPKNLTAANKAADSQPSYSADGEYLAYVKQDTEQYESDLWVLTVRDRKSGNFEELSRTFDRPVLSYCWGEIHKNENSVGYSLLMTIDDRGTEPIAMVGWLKSLDSNLRVDASSPKLRAVVGGINQSVQAVRGNQIIFSRSTSDAPSELYKRGGGPRNPTPLTNHNAALKSQLDLAKAEGFKFEGADGDEVAGWIIKPPGFDPNKKYPVLFLIHGGPQGAWHDEWHGRWNYQLFASPGYVVVAINPRGSTGYGQKFTLQISKDWTGKVYQDLMLGLDHALKTYPYMDGEKVAAAGGSYGGFMVNWIAGHSDRFKALISHAGVFDLTSKYGTTEELWFPEFEFGGTPWDNPQIYRDQSPSGFVKNFKTPTLVIHGALDFRVPDAQGIGMYTALQRRGVPSRLVWFPDEGHWIAKPANRIVWWREMHDWLAKYLK